MSHSLPTPTLSLPSPHPPNPLQEVEKEPERAYMLAKAQGMQLGIETINKCPTAAAAQTPQKSKRARIEASPEYLKGRVERSRKLPEVEISPDGDGRKKRKRRPLSKEEVEGEERIRAVAEHVVKRLKPELVVELLQYMAPRRR